MQIVSSTFALGHEQVDGRRYVTERHIDDAGVEHVIEYGPIGEVDYEAVMIERAAQIEAEANNV